MDRAFDLVDVGARDIYEVDILEAMCALKHLWNASSSSIVQNCWAHARILKPDSGNSTAESENCAVTAAIKKNLCKQAKQLVAPHSKISINAIFNPPGEDDCVTVLSDEKIVRQVLPSEEPDSNDDEIHTVL